MSLSASDAFLDTIAQQAQIAYATEQLQVYQTELQRWHTHPADPVGPYSQTRVQHELMYYAQQVERWQKFLARLGIGPL